MKTRSHKLRAAIYVIQVCAREQYNYYKTCCGTTRVFRPRSWQNRIFARPADINHCNIHRVYR